MELNLLEARKKLKTALQIESTKLTTRQRRVLLLNQVIFFNFPKKFFQLVLFSGTIKNCIK